jgi:hypothetical protein
MYLAPLVSTLNAMLSHFQFAIREEIGPGAGNQQVQEAIGARYGIWIASVFFRWHRVAQSGIVQSKSASLSRLATSPVVCLKGNLNRTLVVRQNVSPLQGIPPSDQGSRQAARAKSCLCPTRSATSRAYEAKPYRMASSSGDSGRVSACTYSPSNRVDS